MTVSAPTDDFARPVPADRVRQLVLRLATSRWTVATSFVLVVGLALGVNAWNLSEAGNGNTYYAAAVRSMTGSWKNFFFGSFDPGGFITVDKPPVFLWIGAASVRVFGYSSWSLLLPSAVAGAATVGLVWLLVRRYFGAPAATLSGLVLALTPISVAVNRLNLPEPFLILTLVAAAGSILLSLERKRWWLPTIAAGVLVGIAFNTKMLAGWIPGPAFALALVIGDGNTWRLALRRVLVRLTLLAFVTFAVSASWMLIVDAWPASDRPYIGGSTDNSVANLALDYNGVGRVDGSEIPGRGGPPNNAQRSNPTRPTSGRSNNIVPGGTQPGQGGNVTPGGTQPQNRAATPGGFGPGGNQPGANARGAGGIIAGTPGLLRMLDDSNGSQIAWFLPFALLGSVLCLWEWRKDRLRRAATILALGWVLLFGGIFSYAQGIYHSYYTSAMAPGIAILVGMTVAAAASLVKRDWRWIIPVLGIAAATLAVQLSISGRFPMFQSDIRPIAIGAVVVAGAMLALFAVRRMRPMPGLALVVGGLLLIPGAWSSYEVAHPSMNTTLPQAGPRQGAAGQSFGSNAFDNGTTQLAAWLQAHHTDGTRWDLAVASAQNASTLIADGQVSVMAIGGFSGNDPTITVPQFADFVANGDVRYVLTSGGPGGGPGGAFGAPRIGNTGPLSPIGGSAPAGPRIPFVPSPPFGTAAAATTPAVGSSAVMSAVARTCTLVPRGDAPTQYYGSLYDCGGAAVALRGNG